MYVFILINTLKNNYDITGIKGIIKKLESHCDSIKVVTGEGNDNGVDKDNLFFCTFGNAGR